MHSLQSDGAHRSFKPVHFEQNDILHDLQHGFRERRFCETHLIQLVVELARNTSQGRQTDLILIDFSKAFDRVNHLDSKLGAQ